MLEPAEIRGWVLRGEQADDETAWLGQIQDWVKGVLLARQAGE